MQAVLPFIDGTICDTRQSNALYGTPAFHKRENILADAATPGSVACARELAERFFLVYMGARPAESLAVTKEWLLREAFPEGEVYLADTLAERLSIASWLGLYYSFAAGIGDRWDDNELHLALGCKSIILEEYAPNWDTVRKYI